MEDEPTALTSSGQDSPRSISHRRQMRMRERKFVSGFGQKGFNLIHHQSLDPYILKAQGGSSSSAGGPRVRPRCYVGSIFYELTENEIKAPFERFGHVVDISMPLDPDTNRHRGYCFLEFDTVQGASNAIYHMNGYLLANRPIKVSNPSDNSDGSLMALPPPQTDLADACRIGFKPTRLRIANVAEQLNEEQLKTIFEAFGKITSLHLMKEGDRHTGEGYISFEQHEAARQVLSEMNNIELLGKTILLEWVTETAGMMQTSEPEMKVTEAYPNASRCIVLEGMIAPEDVDDELTEEVTEECATYGKVESVQIHTNTRKQRVDCFVLFEDPIGATKAQAALDQRMFDGHVITARFFALVNYEQKRFE